MPMFIIALFLKFVVDTARSIRRATCETKPEPLCAGCLHVHAQYGTKAEHVISCAYTGRVRPIRMQVLYCTDYQARDQPARRAIGFVHEIAPAK